MKIVTPYLLLLLFTTSMSCTYSKNFTSTYYQQREALLYQIKDRYTKLYEGHPFSLELKDKELSRIGLEIHTDSIRYIYNFRLDEPYFLDTLDKYKIDVKEVSKLIEDMQEAHCTWINYLDYYEKREKKYLLFMSIRHKKLEAFLKPEKYFTLAFFNDTQPADKKGRLLDREDVKERRKINGEVFRKINGKVFYALLESYR